MWYSKEIRIFLIFCILPLCIICKAQYHPQNSQYMFNGLALNPAYAGSQEVLSLATFYRSSQWGKSFEGAPVTYTFSGDFPLRNPQLALGLLVYNDRISILRQTGTYFAYSFRVKTGEKGRLSFGLQAGFDLLREDQTDLFLVHKQDDLFHLEKHNTFMPNVGVGAYYYTPDLFVGLSLPQLLAYSPNTAGSYKGKLTLSNTKLYGGTTLFSASGDFKVKPSTLLQYTGKGVLFDLNCNILMLKDKFEFGLSWRNKNTLVVMAQVRVQSLWIGYAYDYAIGIPSAVNTSHEIMLRYDFRIRVNAAHPLYLK